MKMATDFNKNAVSSTGGFKPSSVDTPIDIRARVETEADILTIPKPYIGMVIYVRDTGKRFEVLSLKDGKIGVLTVKNGLVNEYRELPYATKEEVAGNYATKAEIDLKVDKEEGKGLSTNDFTELLKAKLEALPTADQLEEMIKNNSGSGSGDCGFTSDYKNAIENELISNITYEDSIIKFESKNNEVISQLEVTDSNDVEAIMSIIKG